MAHFDSFFVEIHGRRIAELVARGDTQQIATRVQAFLEMIQAG